MLQHGINNSVWASGSERGEICGSRLDFSGVEGRAENGVRLLRACGLAELRHVPLALLLKAFGYETEKWDLM